MTGRQMVSRNLEYWRKRKKITQEELSDATDISLRTIQRYESGTYSIPADNLYLISECLKVPIQSFFEESMADIRKTDGKNFKRYRMFNCYSMPYAAKELNMSERKLREYEQGKRHASYSVLRDMANLYGVTIDELIG